jgi:hypothetical protein
MITLGTVCIGAGAVLGAAALVCTFVFASRSRKEQAQLDTYIEKTY